MTVTRDCLAASSADMDSRAMRAGDPCERYVYVMTVSWMHGLGLGSGWV